jgi:hypothetical protein
MSFQIDDTVTDEELAAQMTTVEVEAAYDDAADHELEVRISKTSYNTNYC